MQSKPSEEDVIHLATGGYDHTIRFWIPHEGKCSRVIQHPNSQINDLKITPDRTFLAAASFQHVRIYSIPTIQNNNNPDINLEGFNKNVTSIGFQEDSKWLFSGGEDQITRIWDLRARKNQSQRMQKSISSINTVKLHLSQTDLFIGQQSGHIEVWDIRTNNVLKIQLPLHDSSVQCLTLNPMHDLLAAIDNQGSCHIFSTSSQNLKPILTWRAHTMYGLKCLFSPNGVYLVTTSADHTAKVWKTSDLLENSKNQSFTSASSLMNSSSYSQVSNSNQAPPEPYKLYTCENQRWVWDVAFSADSQFLFTASSDSVVRLWHVETAEMRREYTGHQRAVTSLAFSDC